MDEIVISFAVVRIINGCNDINLKKMCKVGGLAAWLREVGGPTAWRCVVGGLAP
jgi:hypothetical protein